MKALRAFPSFPDGSRMVFEQHREFSHLGQRDLSVLSVPQKQSHGRLSPPPIRGKKAKTASRQWRWGVPTPTRGAAYHGVLGQNQQEPCPRLPPNPCSALSTGHVATRSRRTVCANGS